MSEQKRDLNIIGKRWWFFLISGTVIIAGLIALIAFGLKPGVEFKSGTEVTISFTDNASSPTKAQVTAAISSLGYDSGSYLVRKAGNDYILSLPELNDQGKTALRTALTEQVGPFKDGGFYTVSAIAAGQTVRNASIAVLVSAIGILLYLAWAFRKMPNPLRWGTCAVASLLHDVLVVVGVFAILSGILGWQVDLMFIAAVLTVAGYSVNDTIVIFDRIREGVRRNPGVDFEVVTNRALVETMSRTLITGLGTLFVLIALMIIVGGPIQNLVAVLLVGILTGTYSSIGTAASLLIVWEKKEWGRFIGRKPVAKIAA
jgi:preprotein translocase subunit SecF